MSKRRGPMGFVAECSARRERRDNDRVLERERERRERVTCTECGKHVRGKLAGVCSGCRETALSFVPDDGYDDFDWRMYCDELLAKLSAEACVVALEVYELRNSYGVHTLSTACDAVVAALESFADECAVGEYTGHLEHHVARGIDRAKEIFNRSAYECELEFPSEPDEDDNDPAMQRMRREWDDDAWAAIANAARRVLALTATHRYDRRRVQLTIAAVQGIDEGDGKPTGVAVWDGVEDICEHNERWSRVRASLVERYMLEHVKVAEFVIRDWVW